ncbi:MAG: penicillin-binding protein activator LpoB [Kiritimatiellae bacterium]|nr:penicillin-binding protein activator LpoB [Kiritimatiellia bacterium]MDW8458314.1 penicillin-binding protein activator LpoB [Verrucomicrobiota bacterium]
MRRVMLAAGLVSLAITGGGCAAFRAKVSDVDLDRSPHMRSEFDFRDLRTISAEVVDRFLTSDFLAKHDEPPTIAIRGLENRTTDYLDTKAITDTMRTRLIQSGRVQFVNVERREDLAKEQGYQAANAAPGTAVAIGQQAAARYMMTGSIIEMTQRSPRQVRLSQRRERFYQLTVEVTDLQTGLIAWTTQYEFARAERQPLIGW